MSKIIHHDTFGLDDGIVDSYILLNAAFFSCPASMVSQLLGNGNIPVLPVFDAIRLLKMFSR